MNHTPAPLAFRVVREGTPLDLDQWFQLRVRLWPDATGPEEMTEMLAMIQDPRQQILVAQASDGSLIGFLEAGIRPYADGCISRNVGYIEGWYVLPEWRRRGVGAALVQAAEAWARDQGCREMASDCDLANLVSQEAHARLGYEEVERLVHFRKALE